MKTAVDYKETIVKELEELTLELIQEVIDFVEFLKEKNEKNLQRFRLAPYSTERS